MPKREGLKAVRVEARDKIYDWMNGVVSRNNIDEILTFIIEKYIPADLEPLDESRYEEFSKIFIEWIDGKINNGELWKRICQHFAAPRALGIDEINKIIQERMQESNMGLANDIYEAIHFGKAMPGGEPNVTGETSDGYHTFNELYDHRCLLWINYCLTNSHGTYLVENHYDGWFLLGKETTYGQISYHCPNKYIDFVKGIKRRHPKFDGHSSNAVLVRLEHLAQFGQPPTNPVEGEVITGQLCYESYIATRRGPRAAVCPKSWHDLDQQTKSSFESMAKRISKHNSK